MGDSRYRHDTVGLRASAKWAAGLSSLSNIFRRKFDFWQIGFLNCSREHHSFINFAVGLTMASYHYHEYHA